MKAVGASDLNHFILQKNPGIAVRIILTILNVQNNFLETQKKGRVHADPIEQLTCHRRNHLTKLSWRISLWEEKENNVQVSWITIVKRVWEALEEVTAKSNHIVPSLQLMEMRSRWTEHRITWSTGNLPVLMLFQLGSIVEETLTIVLWVQEKLIQLNIISTKIFIPLEEVWEMELQETQEAINNRKKWWKWMNITT